MKILLVKNLTVSLNKTEEKIIDHISFEVFDNEIIGIAGESGSGKSTLSLSILGLLNSETFRVSGNVFYKGNDILAFSKKNREKLLGKEMTLVLQNPMTAFDPTVSVGKQMVETIKTVKNINFSEARKISIESLKRMNMKNEQDILMPFLFN
ncbi:ABC-type glutathione transport system ATPase component [Clostridium tetanomorphum]|uniref:ABC transporter ATP-binding protein n=1 Tax=Clostridium tetanomorphum TaxID=1553 RepID=A0A923E9W3_CLOTT|nr:ATP-binding cassette domain-containing protein [Clostridium tetanomorphum]KAJ52860.1 oligopeptide ABC transporter (ATP-binding protein) [Clostridium tetanomorphum DSM 665]MBC2399150.1 ABC transporter ATP-binding protein [Clostridium tetanomorphum]MBP1865449.1 ABC-type glutathione transport system ATPase component [Clostridium tetanomorphum]NRS84784.1 ABC-type glutathione transport system ATPase component [Clostridium tetanomorphum]NRZ98002.1 ABC-type glutathione transport system ATPase comp